MQKPDCDLEFLTLTSLTPLCPAGVTVYIKAMALS